MAEQAKQTTIRIGKRTWLVWRSMRRFFRTLGHLRFFRSTSYNKEVIPKEGGGIIAVYHESLIDGIWIACTISRFPIFMGMAEIGTWPVIGKLAKMFNVILVDRSDAASRSVALDHAVDVALAGHMQITYINGKCVRKGETPEYKPGPAIMAMRSGLPVYPAASKGSGDVFPLIADLPPRDFSRIAILRRLEQTPLWMKLHDLRVKLFVWERFFPQKPMHIMFGEPMYGRDYDSATEMTVAIGNKIDEMRELLPD